MGRGAGGGEENDADGEDEENDDSLGERCIGGGAE